VKDDVISVLERTGLIQCVNCELKKSLACSSYEKAIGRECVLGKTYEIKTKKRPD